MLNFEIVELGFHNTANTTTKTQKQSDYRAEQSLCFDSKMAVLKTKGLVGRMTAQPHNRFAFCIVVVKFAVNGNQALHLQMLYTC